MQIGTAIFLVILGIAIIIIAPIITIWALNTLFVGVWFTHEIPLTIYTYLAILWIGGFFGALFKGAVNSSN